MRRLLPLLLPTLLLACKKDKGQDTAPKGGGDGDDTSVEWDPGPPIVPGVPTAGVAEGFLEVPVGAPLGGYTGRCKCFGGDGEYDNRRVPYTTRFTPSVGVQTRPKIAVLWLDNGDEDLVLVKTDAIYSFEKVVTELEERLGAATGRELAGNVVMATNHSHSAPANFVDGLPWYLGGDRFNREVFERTVLSMEEVALEAWDHREPAAIGIGMARDWDPDDRVYRDRRPENDEVQFFDDIPAGRYKDPNLTVLRVDTAAGDPMGVFFAFGMHGTVLGGENQLWSTESGGGVEVGVEEQFDAPVVVGFLQHGGGDLSPAGVDREFAKIESLGELAAGSIIDLWAQTPTSSDPIRLETVTRSIDTRPEVMSVTRPWGDLVYTPYDPDEDYRADDQVYDGQGRILTPIDEFNTESGGAFCGSLSDPDDTESDPLIPGFTLPSAAYPYRACVEVSAIGRVIAGFFFTDQPDAVENLQLPLPSTVRAKTSATRIGPLPIRTPDGEDVTEEALLAFFPGETTSVFTEQFRRRVRDELGFEYAFPIGYAQDHEGYLLTPEDWLLGGYEIDITIWGPLGGEHIMEGVLTGIDEILLTDTVEPHDQLGRYTDTQYAEVPLPENEPDRTPEAGTVATEAPEYLLLPLEGLELELAPPAEVRRVSDIVQMVWEGGDPSVDLPEVYLERQADDGSWVEVTSASGRAVSSSRHDFLLATTPDPLYPFTDAQRHTWWLGWQGVSHFHDRAGLPEGTYRLHIYGRSYAGGADTWPWPTDAYEITSDPFVVVPADLDVSFDGTTLTASIPAPAHGWRLVDLQGSSQGANPVHDATVSFVLADGSTTVATTADGTIAGGRTSWTLTEIGQADVVAIEVVDGYGNAGRVELAD